jgi:hypothetical protein
MNSERCAADRPSKSSTVDAIAAASAVVVGYVLFFYSAASFQLASCNANISVV